MASIQFAAHIETIRGSIGATTFSRNRPGNFIRRHVIPRDPGSLAQLVQRQHHATMLDRWRNTLTNDQRIVWNDLAMATSFRSPTCRAYHPTGQSLYLRANVFRRALALAPVDVPDTVAQATPSTFTLGAGGVAGYPYITADADWHDGKTGNVAVWSSPMLSQTVYYWRGPWTRVPGFAIVALAGMPLAITLSAALDDGDRVFLRFKAVFGTQGTVVTIPQHAYWDYNV